MWSTISEADRLAALRALGILDTPAEAEFEALARAASLACGVPISLVSLVDEKRQWFKANVGLPGVTETPRELAFCAHAILGEDIMEVPDATQDSRFANNQLVTSQPNIRFYAGAPIRLASGAALGTLCVIDRAPLRLTETQAEILRALATAAGYALDSWSAKRREGLINAQLRQSEVSLRHSEAMLNRVSAVAGVGGWELDLASGAGSATPQSFEIFRAGPQEALNRELAMRFYHPHARAALQDAINRAVEGAGGWDLELPATRADGAEIWVRNVGAVEQLGGKPGRLTGAIQDITERILERQALCTAHERLSLATESCEIGIWDWEINPDRMRWDARMFALYGLSMAARDLSIAFWRERLHPQDRARADQAVQAGILGQRPFDAEFRVVWPNGTVRTLRGTGRVTRDSEGRAIRMVGTNWDVTESRAAEAMRAARDAANRASRAKSAFLATMSHELRSPISGLLGVVEALRGTPLDRDQAQMTSMIHDAGSQLLGVMNDILDFSKIEAGALTIKLEPTDLLKLAAEIARPYRLEAAEKGLGFTLTVAPGLPQWGRTDPARLRQILQNLLGNALKFTRAGEICLEFEPVAGPDGPRLRVAVRDTGIGMSTDVRERLFQPFSQADGSTSRPFGGTGLGLSIAQQLAHLMGGAISVNSQPGTGSCFALDVPFRPCAALKPGGDPAPQSAAPAGHAAILVVDDDPTMRWTTKLQLTKLGYRVETAEDGLEALTKLQSSPYDLVLTDCHMPRLNGVGLTQHLRAAGEPKLREMPIIGVTADVTEAQRAQCLQAGMNDLAIKPLLIDALAQLLSRVLPVTVG